MKQPTYDTPFEELVGELQWTLGAINDYRSYLSKFTPRNAKQIACEERKQRALARAIAHIKSRNSGESHG